NGDLISRPRNSADRDATGSATTGIVVITCHESQSIHTASCINAKQSIEITSLCCDKESPRCRSGPRPPYRSSASISSMAGFAGLLGGADVCSYNFDGCPSYYLTVGKVIISRS